MNLKNVLQRTKEIIRRKHYSYSTEETYCGWIARYSAWLKKQPSGLSSEHKLERFVTALAKQRVSASTQNQAFNAIRFLYVEVLNIKLGDVNGLRARREATIRYAPSKDETRAILQAVRDTHGYPTRLIVHLLYGAGLRVSEPLNLRIKDVCIADSRLIVRGGKGGKDRAVSLPCALIPAIKSQVKLARSMWERDAANGVPVPLPGRLDKKYPSSRFAWQWYWIFPSSSTCRHPRTGETVRWRCHEANVQRCVKAAASECDLGGVVTPHCLRHAYATHAMQQGAFVRDVQLSMGHVSLETTMGYLHAESGRVASPLETLSAHYAGIVRQAETFKA
jgi:integron integrase